MWSRCVWGETEEEAILLIWCTSHNFPGRSLCNLSLCKRLYRKKLCKKATLYLLRIVILRIKIGTCFGTKRVKMYWLFLDLQKAFDAVVREAL
jgi:hypothetical protein